MHSTAQHAALPHLLVSPLTGFSAVLLQTSSSAKEIALQHDKLNQLVICKPGNLQT